MHRGAWGKAEVDAARAVTGVGAKRPRSLAEQLGFVGLGAAGASFVYPMVNRATGLGVFCPLRTLTGVPCPACGMTTAATRLAAGDLHGALAANPFVLVLAGLTLFMAMLMALRAVGLAAPPTAWSAGRQRAAKVAAVALAAGSWLFQLHRFGWI
jgi:hypothetical protein